MFLSLLDLMRQQTGWPMRSGLPAPGDPLPALPQPQWADEAGFLVLRVPLKGIDPKSLQVQVSETSLALAGHRSQEERVEGPDFFRASASYSLFARTLPLPARVLPRESQANWLAGEVLEVRLRKA